jgi:thiazole synthase
MSVRRWRQESTSRSARNFRALRELRECSPHIPKIIDAGIGLPSHACQAMEWGFDGVFLYFAVALIAICTLVNSI